MTMLPPPVLFSPLVLALIWKWILQRYGLLKPAVQAGGGQQVDWLPNASSAWTVVGRKRVFYTLILLAGLLRGGCNWIPLRRGAPLAGSRCRCSCRACSLWAYSGLILAVRAFDEVYVLTGGGSGDDDLSHAVHLSTGLPRRQANTVSLPLYLCCLRPCC